jgi:hypothetical protein
MVLSAACSACTGDQDKPVETTPPPPAVAAQLATPDMPVAPDATAEALKPIAESALKELLDTWLATQNKGQFEAYEGLYAAKFYGVKRAGPREVRFDRASWLKDRERMFQKPIKVEARDVTFHATSASADIDFTQQWASGKFQDVGPKRLFVVREGGALKIAQEEMLRSDVIDAKSEHAALPFYFTLALDSGVYVSLPHAKVPQNLGPLQNEHGEKNAEVFTVSRTVADKDLSQDVRDLKTKKLRVEGGCTATISEFRVMTRVVPHFGERGLWTGNVEGQKKPPLPAAQVASAAYALGEPRLFAKLAGCSDGRFAVVDGALQPLTSEPVDDPVLAERALKAFGKLPGVLAQQKEFLKQAEHPEGNWWDEGTEVAIFKHPKSGQLLISVLAILGAGCDEFSAREWAVFEQKGKTLKRVSPALSPPDRVQDAIDADGDGKLEILGENDNGTDIVLIWPEQNERGTSLEYAYRDCPC